MIKSGNEAFVVFHQTPNNQSWAGAERWEYDYKLQWGGNKLWQSIYINTRIQWEKTNKQQIQITITNTNYNGEEKNDLHLGVY